MDEVIAPCRVLIADPPWKFGDRLAKKTRGAAAHYQVLTLEEICAFPLPPIADDAHLLLWRVAAMQQEALDVIRAWGFVLKSEIVWRKKTKRGKRHFGMGRQVRMEHEVCLIATRGRPQRVKVRNERSIITAPVGRHSAKPDAFYELVDRLYDGPKAELFARRRWPGWECYGNELPAIAA